MMIINSYAFASASNGPYLDSLAVQPRAAHGLRKLISTATLCMRVRNRTTGVETDIGFSGDKVDVAAIEATHTGQYVDVTKLYDQTGNGYHFAQATVARMPNIVAVGGYQGALKFAGSDMASAALPMGTPYWGVYTRHNFSAIATRVFIELSANASGANTQAAFLYAAATNRMYMYSQNGSAAARQMWANCFIGIAQRTYLFNRSVVGTGEFTARESSTAQTLTSSGGSTEQTGNFNSYLVSLGARADGSLPAVMDLHNLAQYDADTSAIAADIEAIVGVAP
jgi:hypothetical protein